MNKIFTIMFACCLLISNVSFAKDEQNTFNKIYENDKQVVCGGKTYPIPTYFPYINDKNVNPYQSSEINLSAECSSKGIKININVCKPQQTTKNCEIGAFVKQKISSATLDLIEEMFLPNSFTMVNEVAGVVVEGSCNGAGYCTHTKFYWIDDDKKNITFITSSNPNKDEKTISELKKSVKSYIENMSVKK